MRILLLGANGMLGTMLHRRIQQQLPDAVIVATDRDSVDITSKASVIAALTQHQPDVVINTAAYTAVDKAEEEKDIAELINATAVGIVAQSCADAGITMLHVSTDYVFDGTRIEGYLEDDPVAPKSVYGKTKAAGETLLASAYQSKAAKYYIVRTAWLYGPDGPNFVETMLSLSESKDEVSVVNDQHGSPTFTQDLSDAIITIITQQEEYTAGIYHVTNSKVATWYEFTKEIFSLTNTPCKVLPCSTVDFPRPAPRPAYSILLNTKLPALRSWREALREYLEQRN